MLKVNDNKPIVFVATVKSTKDPKKLGRVQVELKSLDKAVEMRSRAVKKLPRYAPARPPFCTLKCAKASSPSIPMISFRTQAFAN